MFLYISRFHIIYILSNTLNLNYNIGTNTKLSLKCVFRITKYLPKVFKNNLVIKKLI